jgi:plasmid stabilization system protein ParE
MKTYLLTPRAKADIFEIWSYIARDSESAADRVEQAVYEACQFISENLSAGHFRPELTTRTLLF